MARAVAAIVAAVALAGCGLAAKDVDVQLPLEAGGGAPTDGTGSVNASSLVAPLAADVGSLKSVTLGSARLEATDGQDLAFVSSATLTISGSGLPDVELGTLAAGQTQFSVVKTELKPYLLAGGTLAAKLAYTSRPVVKRTLTLTLTLHGELL